MTPEPGADPPRRIDTVICDFGGVLTTPMLEAFTAYQSRSGVSLETLGQAMAALTERDGINPLFVLETGDMTEGEFHSRLGAEISRRVGRPVDMDRFGRHLFEHLHPNDAMIDVMRSLRSRGLKLGLCTNNVREWESLWRSMFPVDEIFEVVVDSAFVGIRKPDPAIYRLTLERLGAEAESTLFVDDIEINCAAARELGMAAVWFRTTEQAIEEIEAAVAATR